MYLGRSRNNIAAMLEFYLSISDGRRSESMQWMREQDRGKEIKEEGEEKEWQGQQKNLHGSSLEVSGNKTFSTSMEGRWAELLMRTGWRYWHCSYLKDHHRNELETNGQGSSSISIARMDLPVGRRNGRERTWQEPTTHKSLLLRNRISCSLCHQTSRLTLLQTVWLFTRRWFSHLDFYSKYYSILDIANNVEMAGTALLVSKVSGLRPGNKVAI